MGIIDKENRTPMINKIIGADWGEIPPNLQHTGAGASASAPQSPTPDQGGRPPEPPIQHGRGGGGGGFKKWRQNNKGWTFILGLAGMLLVIVLLSLINDFFTERQVTRLERLNRIPPNSVEEQLHQSVPEVSVTASKPTVNTTANTTSNPFQVIELKDGITPILPENARIVLRGPMTDMVIVNTAARIKSFTGEFKLVLEADGTRAWTPGFDKHQQSPNDMTDFINQLPNWPKQSRVRIYVQPGTVVELIT